MEGIPPTILVICAIISIQIGSALAISLFPVFGPQGILFFRMLIAGVGLCLLYKSFLARAIQKAPVGIILLGLTMLAQSATFYEALSRIPLGIAVSIEFLGPLGLALATSRRALDVLCVTCAGVGILLLTPSIGQDLDPIGLLFAFLSAAGWICFIITSRRLSRQIDSGVGLALAMLVSAIALSPFAGVQALTNLANNLETIIAISAVAVFSAAIPLLFEFIALRSIPPRKFGILISFEPVVATVIGITFLSDAITLRSWIAVALISIASLGITIFDKRRLKRNKSKHV